MNCKCCEKPFSFCWTDSHGVGACNNCGLPYVIYHYEGEGDERKRVEKEPECPIFEEWIPVAQRYRNETGGRVFPAEFDMGFRDGRSYSGATPGDVRAWNEWLDAHKDELPKPRETQPEAA